MRSPTTRWRWLATLTTLAWSGLACAQDFEGRWKVPEQQTIDSGRCEAGEIKECLRLAWTLEAGLREAGQSDVQRLEAAVAWHTRACTLDKRTPCPNAERVQQQRTTLGATTSTDARTAFLCTLGLDGSRRFERPDGVARAVVVAACTPLFSPKLRRGLEAGAQLPSSFRMTMVLQALIEHACPTLKAAHLWMCEKQDASEIAPDLRERAARGIFRALLDGKHDWSAIATRSDELFDRLIGR